MLEWGNRIDFELFVKEGGDLLKKVAPTEGLFFEEG